MAHKHQRFGPMKQPRAWVGFVHLLARFYQDYRAAIIKASKRRIGRAVDIDVHVSKQGTLWALHWGTIGKNKLIDPLGKLSPNAKIKDLTDFEIERLRSKTGKHPYRLRGLLHLCAKLNVRAEVELKVPVRESDIIQLVAQKDIYEMHRRKHLQFKTLAAIPRPEERLKPVHDAGGVTILSFTGYTGPGVSKQKLWPCTDYIRGKAKWLP